MGPEAVSGYPSGSVWQISICQTPFTWRYLNTLKNTFYSRIAGCLFEDMGQMNEEDETYKHPPFLLFKHAHKSEILSLLRYMCIITYQTLIQLPSPDSPHKIHPSCLCPLAQSFPFQVLHRVSIHHFLN